MLLRLFLWVDSHPLVYVWLVAAAVGLMATTLHWAWERTGGEPSPRRDRAVAFVFLLLLLAWRWPFLLDPAPLNPDEPAFVAGALTLQNEPAFWRSLDTTTAGPLTPLALLPTHWLGVPQDYFNARLVGLFLVWGSLCLTGSILIQLWNRRVAFVALVPPALFFVAAIEGDFLHYSSEHVPLFLLALSAWLLARGCHGSRAAWWFSGVVAGLLPWAKLQAGPFAVVLSLAALVVARRSPETRPEWRRRVAEYLLAGIVPTFVLFGMIAAQGEWRNFVESYVLNNLRYTEASSMAAGLRGLVRLSLLTQHVPAYLVTPVVLVTVSLGYCLALRCRPALAWWLGACATGVAILVILAPGRGFTHYLLLLPIPLTWWCAAALHEILHGVTSTRGRFAVAGAALILPMTLQLSARLARPLPAPLGQLAESWRHPRNEIGDTVHTLRRPEDTLATWGWDSHLYVETGLPQATREAQTERQIRPSPQRDSYYRPRFLAELERKPPAFFIDAVGPGAFEFGERSSEAHENFPALAAFVATRYELVADFHDSRLYMRRDRTVDAPSIARALSAAGRKNSRAPEPTIEMNVLPGRPGRSLSAHHHVSMVEPPATVTWALEGTERTFTLEYGYDPRAYEQPTQGNGTEFTMTLLRPDGTAEQIFHRLLDPAHATGDRGTQIMRLVLPSSPAGTKLLLNTGPGPDNDNSWDWAYAARAGFGRGPLVSPRFLPQPAPAR